MRTSKCNLGQKRRGEGEGRGEEKRNQIEWVLVLPKQEGQKILFDNKRPERRERKRKGGKGERMRREEEKRKERKRNMGHGILRAFDMISKSFIV